MARRRGKPKAAADAKGKLASKRHNASSLDRNRASPAPVIKLCRSLTPEQRDAVVYMGQGSFLDIKCGHLHNPVINWFVRCYNPARRAFVVPCRGVIPLTEESVHIMTGLPRGQVAVKYYADYNLEADVAARLFPEGTSRPKVSDIGKLLEQYTEADDTFKELWMLYIVSTIVAPTTDTKMSNSCYPMLLDIPHAREMNLCKFVVDELHDSLSKGKYTKGCLLYCMLRYFDALDTSHLEFELVDARFAINAWTSLAVDAVGALDVQEYDTTTFGVLELKDEYKEEFAREMGLFGGANGFTEWMNLNTHPTCRPKRRNKAFTLMQSFASSLNGLLCTLVQGFTEIDEFDESNDEESASSSSESEEEQVTVTAPPIKKPCEKGKNVVESTVIKTAPGRQHAPSTSTSPAMHSQIMVPSESDVERSDSRGDLGGLTPDSPMDSTQHVDELIRGSAASLAVRLSNLKNDKNASVVESRSNSAIKLTAMNELGMPVGSCSEDSACREKMKSTTQKDHVLQTIHESVQEGDFVTKDVLTKVCYGVLHVSVQVFSAESRPKI